LKQDGGQKRDHAHASYLQRRCRGSLSLGLLS